MKENRASNLISTLLSVLILIVIGGAAYYIVQTIQRSTQRAVAPFEQANSGLQTQVAELLHPTPTVIPDPVTYITEVRSLARLETIQYSVEKVITAEIGQGTFGFLFGDKLLFVAHGTVIAGIDMGKMQPSDLQLQGGTLHVHLPPSEVFIATLDNDKSYVYDRQTGALTKGDQTLETTARQAAEGEIRKAAIEDGILDQADKNAVAFLGKFFAALGYPNAVLETTPSE